MTFTSTPITVKDANSADKPLVAYSNGAASAFAHPLLDNAGAIISPATADNQAAGNGKLDVIIANTGAGSLSVTVTPTVTVGTYSDGMVVGGKLAITPAARLSGGSGFVQQVLVTKKTTQNAPFDLFIFHTNPSAAFTDHANLPDISADFDKLVGVIRCTDVVDCGVPQILQALQQALQFDLPSGGNTLYVVPVIRGSDTYATTDAVTISLGILQD